MSEVFPHLFKLCDTEGGKKPKILQEKQKAEAIKGLEAGVWKHPSIQVFQFEVSFF